jgi:hypothetical protein
LGNVKPDELVILFDQLGYRLLISEVMGQMPHLVVEHVRQAFQEDQREDVVLELRGIEWPTDLTGGMRSVSAEGFRGLSAEDCSMVIDFIEEHAEDHQLSMRLLGPSLRKLMYARQEHLDWRPLVKTQLQILGRKQQVAKRLDTKAHDVRSLQEAIRKHPENVNDQQAYWQERTGKSRASFYRTLARFRETAIE